MPTTLWVFNPIEKRFLTAEIHSCKVGGRKAPNLALCHTTHCGHILVTNSYSGAMEQKYQKFQRDFRSKCYFDCSDLLYIVASCRENVCSELVEYEVNPTTLTGVLVAKTNDFTRFLVNLVVFDSASVRRRGLHSGIY